MAVMILIVKLNLQKMFDFKNHLLKSLGFLASLVLSFVYALMFAFLIKTPEFVNLNISEKEFLTGIIYAIILFTLFRGIFPIYKQIVSMVKPNYPLSKIKIFFLNLTNELVSPYFLSFCVFISTFTIYLPDHNFFFAINAVSGLIGAHLLKRIMQRVVEYKIKKPSNLIYIFIAGILLITHFFIAENLYSFFDVGNIILGLSLLFIINISIEDCYKEQREFAKNILKFSFFNSDYVKILFGNKLLRVTVIVEVLVRSVFIMVDWVTYEKKGFHIGENEIFITLFLSPVSAFTYYLNNTFGYTGTVWFTINKATDDIFVIVKFMLKLLIIPISINAFISFAYYLIAGNLTLFNISFYLSSLILLFTISVFSSLYFPKSVVKVFTAGSNTSVISAIVSMGVVVLSIYLVQLISHYYILVSIMISYLAICLLQKSYYKLKSDLFEKLFKAG